MPKQTALGKSIENLRKGKDVPGVRESHRPIALLCSDIHLSHRPPVARSAEPHWYRSMEVQIEQLRAMQERLDVPIICAGDIFDRWDSPPELINFAIATLPKMYAIPGQHDLPNHSYENIKRSAYWTLVAAGVVDNLPPKKSVFLGKGMGNDWYMIGFPWGTDVIPAREATNMITDDQFVAVIHSYIWMKGKSFPNAPPESRIKAWLGKLKGYGTAVFGDNHQGFSRGISGKRPFIFNCGTFMRRKIDEMGYYPQIGILQADGLVLPMSLDCSADKFIDVSGIEKATESALDASDFIQEMAGLARTIVDFGDAMKEFCQRNNISGRVQKMIQEAMEK
jgi:DNA repair exonuclease SbcCD nuclease subunit